MVFVLFQNTNDDGLMIHGGDGNAKMMMMILGEIYNIFHCFGFDLIVNGNLLIIIKNLNAITTYFVVLFRNSFEIFFTLK